MPIYTSFQKVNVPNFLKVWNIFKVKLFEYYTAQSTISEKDKQIAELLKATQSHDLSMLEKLNQLECNKERDEELKRLKAEYEQVTVLLKEEQCRSREMIAECDSITEGGAM